MELLVQLSPAISLSLKHVSEAGIDGQFSRTESLPERELTVIPCSLRELWQIVQRHLLMEEPVEFLVVIKGLDVGLEADRVRFMLATLLMNDLRVAVDKHLLHLLQLLRSHRLFE